MRYEDYKELSTLEREEWDFRFAGGVRYNFPFYVAYCLAFLAMVYASLFLAYLVGTSPELSAYVDNFVDVIVLSMRFAQIGMLVLLVTAVLDLYKILKYFFGVREFMKRVGVKPRGLAYYLKKHIKGDMK